VRHGPFKFGKWSKFNAFGTRSESDRGFGAPANEERPHHNSKISIITDFTGGDSLETTRGFVKQDSGLKDTQPQKRPTDFKCVSLKARFLYGVHDVSGC
jgi:hypothetical protein